MKGGGRESRARRQPREIPANSRLDEGKDMAAVFGSSQVVRGLSESYKGRPRLCMRSGHKERHRSRGS